MSTKVEKTRRYFELTGMGKTTLDALAPLVAQMTRGLGEVGKFSEPEIVEMQGVIAFAFEQVSVELVESHVLAFADAMDEEVLDYLIAEAEHPLSARARAALPEYKKRSAIMTAHLGERIAEIARKKREAGT